MKDMEHNSTALLSLPHVGLRKLKGILAIFIGFWIWQGIRLFFPDLEIHPMFVYIYGFLEIRETSDKTKDFGMLRIKATLVAILIGLPMLFLRIKLTHLFTDAWYLPLLDLVLILGGTLLVLEIAQKIGCKNFTGIAVVVFIILLIYHADDERYLYATLRAFQTIIGVFIAWLINVVFFPYPNQKKKG